jgi:hypothetical protein
MLCKGFQLSVIHLALVLGFKKNTSLGLHIALVLGSKKIPLLDCNAWICSRLCFFSPLCC